VLARKQIARLDELAGVSQSGPAILIVVLSRQQLQRPFLVL
jgi:hypothetical protein